MNIKKIYIKGMHCVSCEKLLEDEFKNIAGVEEVRVDRKKNEAEIGWDEKEPAFSDIEKVARKFGYDAFEEPSSIQGKKKKTSWTDWLEAVLIVLIFLFLFKIFQSFGLIERIDFKSSDINYGVSFLIGLAASISSCLAVVGAVIIGFSEKYRSEGKGFYQNALRPNLFFHVGRLAAFFLLGGILGLIGGEINISGNFVAVFTIIISVVMAWLGLNILGILPPISKFGFHMPKNLTGNWDRLKKSEHQLAPFILGAGSFFLPCGFTQSMQIFALASGSFLAGALSLFLFALGTMPVLLALGATVSWTKNQGLIVFQKVAGFLILLFAVYTFNSGMALKGVKTDVIGSRSEKSVSKDETDPSENEQTVEMHVTSRGFEPNVLKIKKGVPVKWVIRGDQVTSCTNKIIIPSLNISKSISFGENVIRFLPDKTGEIPFSCWMGMVRGKFVVE